MGRYCDGDSNAAAALYKLLFSRVFSYLMRLSRSRPVAEDVLQQTFLKVHRARKAYVRGANPVPWIFAIAYRTFIDETRRKKRSSIKLAHNDKFLVEPVADIAGRAEGSAPEAIDPEKREALAKAIQELPQGQKQAVILVKLEGKSIAEAAEIAGTTPGAMKLRVHRGCNNLRKRLFTGTDCKD